MMEERVVKRVWNLANGTLNTEEYPEIGSKVIQNEFAPGSSCEKLYEEAYDLRCKLVKLYGEAAGKDLEIIFDKLSEVAEHLGCKMFEYGVMHGKGEMLVNDDFTEF